MAFDRTKWQPAKLESNKDISNKTEEQMKSNYSADGRPGFHTLKEGINAHRICPPHDSNDPSFQPKVTTWLPREVDEMKEDKPTGKKIIANRPVFNSRVHGETEKDIVEEYINFVYKLVADSIQDKDERASKMSPINGWRDNKTKKWNPGIRFSTAFVFYSFESGKLARLELWKADKDKMEDLNISEDANEVIETDCFSDPNDGVSLLITRQKDKDGKWENVLNKREFNPKKYKTWDEFMASERLTDEQLMELDKAPSLKEIYKSYKRSDFELALKGLQIFDEKNKFGVFEHDEFISIIEEIDAYYPEDELAALEGKGQEGKSKSDKFDAMDRKELKSYIMDQELEITVKPGMPDDEVRRMLREYKAPTQSNKATEQEPADDKLPEEKAMEEHLNKPKNEAAESTDKGDLPWDKDVVDSDKAQAVKDKLAAMKARMAAGKK